VLELVNPLGEATPSPGEPGKLVVGVVKAQQDRAVGAKEILRSKSGERSAMREMRSTHDLPMRLRTARPRPIANEGGGARAPSPDSRRVDASPGENRSVTAAR
jgi:hypothetical protein